MEFITKRTIDLTHDEKHGMVELFNEVFEKERTIEEFDRQFLNNCDGYSYHTFALAEGKIVAANTMIPSVYSIGDVKLKFVNSVDTMIAKHHRGLENFYDMARASFNYSESLGYDAVYGFPNDSSYTLFTQLKFMKDVGRLDTYCLPYRIGGIKKGLSFLNPLSAMFCRIWAGCSNLLASSNVTSFMIEKDASYNETRYKRGDGIYSYNDVSCPSFVYKIKEHEGVRTAFIIDVFGKSPKAFNKAVRYLLKNERKNFDLILYVGHLPFGNTGLIKIPRKYEPKRFNFTAGIFSKKAIDKKSFFEIENWDINLSNYDII